MLAREGHLVLTAENGPEAIEILKNQHVDVVLLDYYMPGMTGEEVVEQLREFNPLVQVILQTGYASDNPPREMLRRLDIQGYYDKSEGPEKLLLWTDVGLKASFAIQLLEKSRRGLQYILDVTPDLHKIQPLDDLLQGILWQVSGLLGAVNSFLAVFHEGGYVPQKPVETESFLAMVKDFELIIRASTGRFKISHSIKKSLEKEKVSSINDVLINGTIQVVDASTIVPLMVGESTIGVIYLDRPTIQKENLDIVQLFANQAAVAIHNVQLYEMAAIDSLTGVYARGFFEQVALREFRTAYRSQHDISMLMADVDNLKAINDSHGHLVGDKALMTVGEILRNATRGNDTIGRIGGDEFAIILAQTSSDGALRVGKRIFSLLENKTIDGSSYNIDIKVSIGACTLVKSNLSADEIIRPVTRDYFVAMYNSVVQYADDALYQAKAQGGNQVFEGDHANWE